jgi:hypothetical protein
MVVVHRAGRGPPLIHYITAVQIQLRVECVERKFVKLIDIKFHENLLCSSWVVTCIQKDRWTDRAELLDTFL